MSSLHFSPSEEYGSDSEAVTVGNTTAPILYETNIIPIVNLEDDDCDKHLEHVEGGAEQHGENGVIAQCELHDARNAGGSHTEHHGGDVDVDQDSDETETKVVGAQDGESDYQETRAPENERNEIASVVSTCGSTVCVGGEGQCDTAEDKTTEEDILLASVFAGDEELKAEDTESASVFKLNEDHGITSKTSEPGNSETIDASVLIPPRQTGKRSHRDLCHRRK
ncbi:hypothetical protein JG687_00018593 [Phytophthora cactorum]|uniref:Uncharacterized protein n=1 Tax=Phytophthora cactorum TaxID=29920 RepID=A0A329T132_9STRA|nr:hypothetical protein Pcac1_g3858 [Phytophthora cactorum]KAG2800438.1 hypothetical protein PC111_g19975 [Phytophthora cactorum]KAG2804305.1 hypothetical protein PC112_g18782 [Phytophthora cactorum]KAG2888454.1 hypothetical protein PC115_g20045 [Phytophthora cactorum]KAG2894977.1 hypothetical protein PC114_g15673 [Phytophthora cactorum]